MELSRFSCQNELPPHSNSNQLSSEKYVVVLYKFQFNIRQFFSTTELLFGPSEEESEVLLIISN